MSDAIRHVTIRGRVQGVGYRAWVEHRARAHGLEGWVRNLRDGSVEAVLAGPADAVAEMVSLCRRGPSSAPAAALPEGPPRPAALESPPAPQPFSLPSPTSAPPPPSIYTPPR